MEKEFRQEYCRSESADVVANGEDRGHDDITRLHDDIGNEEPQQCAGKGTHGFVDIHQIAGDKQKSRHMKGVDKILDVGVAVAEIGQVKGNHKKDEQTLQHVELVNPFPFGCTPGAAHRVIISVHRQQCRVL